MLRGLCACRGTNRFRTAMPCWPAIAEGDTRLENFSTGADCASTLGCVRSLGVEVERNEGSVVIHGRGAKLTAPSGAAGLRQLRFDHADAERHSGGTGFHYRAYRRRIAFAASDGANYRAAGDDGRKDHVAEWRTSAVARYGRKAEGDPLRHAGGQRAGEILCAVCRACSPMARQPSSSRYGRAITANWRCGRLGSKLTQAGNETRIAGGQKLRGIEAVVPGDISSAAFFLCAAGLFPGSQLVIEDLLMNPTRARLLDILILMGIGISVTQIEEQHGELRGTVKVEGRELKGITIAGADTAALIDEIPVLAAIAPYTSGGMEIRDARELRVKESDRIAAIATNLRAMGAEVEEREDGLKIPGGQKLRGAEVDSLGDHRIAMAFAVAALRAEGETRIRGAEAAVISYPEFFEALERVVER